MEHVAVPREEHHDRPRKHNAVLLADARGVVHRILLRVEDTSGVRELPYPEPATEAVGGEVTEAETLQMVEELDKQLDDWDVPRESGGFPLNPARQGSSALFHSRDRGEPPSPTPRMCRAFR